MSGWQDLGQRVKRSLGFGRKAPTVEDVTNAIRDHKVVYIGYTGNGHQKNRRIKPYAVGVTKKGNTVIRAFQQSGDTLRGVPKWKLFRLDRINYWSPTMETFQMPDSLYNPNGDGTMDTVLYQADFGQRTDVKQPEVRATESGSTNTASGTTQQQGAKELQGEPKKPKSRKGWFSSFKDKVKGILHPEETEETQEETPESGPVGQENEADADEKE